MSDNDRNIWHLLDRYFTRAAEDETYDTDAAWRTASRRAFTRELAIVPPSPSRTRWWLAVALAACLTVAVIGTHRTTYQTAPGEQLTVTLSDGSRVTLAPSSRLRLSWAFGRATRGVSLAGEAYFAVVHDPRHPFAVQAGHATALDVGTEFDVRAYTNVVRVVVNQGRVDVLSGAARTALAAGEMATVDSADRLTGAVATDTNVTAWRTGRLVFHDTPVPEIVADLARWYNLDIAVDPTLRGQRVTAQWANVPAERAVNELAAAISAHVTREGRHVLLAR